MSEIVIRINTDNAAFQDGMGDHELAAILNTIGHFALDVASADAVGGMALFDSNGNRVGRVEVTS